ncbi:hypothetical protein [Frankia sp. CiP1_Cm_nod1]|uniref:hypothetical protein n=1 Tax=Frankia sp. CiP1_Cm_nod1 TaxID=2897160 RepID=UPI0020240B4D
MRRIALHILGESDVGLFKAGAEEIEARLAALRSSDPVTRDIELAGTPVSRFVSRIGAGPDGPERILLIATTGGTRATGPLADVVAEYVSRHTGGGGRVTVEYVVDPALEPARDWIRQYIERYAIDETTRWELPLGGGSTGLVLGLLFEVLIRGFPVTLRTEDDAVAVVELGMLTWQEREEAMKRWLVRHRFYDALAKLDPRWEPLACRQAVNVAAVLTAACGPRDDGHWLLDDRARAALFEAVQASFAEGLARQEITDGAAARTWLRRFATAHVPADLHLDVLRMLGCPPWRQLAVDPAMAERVGAPVAALLSPEVVCWHRKVIRNSHGALGVVAEPPAAVVALQNDWIASQHRGGLLADYPAWLVREPPAAGRRVLLLRVLRTDQRKDDDVLDQVLARLGAGEVLLVELRTAQGTTTPPRPTVTGPFTVAVTEKEITETPSLAAAYQRELVRFLDEEVPGADLVDEVAVVLPLGAKALVTAAMLAAVDWSVRAAAPLQVLTTHGDHNDRGVVATRGVHEDGDRALAALGLDGVLAELAVTALRNLDLTVAERLLRRGSARLHGLADEVRELRRDAFRVPESAPGVGGHDDRTSAAEVSLACARLRLCGQIAEEHPWDAAYLATSVLDHTFRMPDGQTRRCQVEGIGRTTLTKNRGWVAGPAEPTERPQDWKHLAPWQVVRDRQNGHRPSSQLRDLRNSHPLSHGIDQPWENRYWGGGEEKAGKRDGRRESIAVPTASHVVQLLAEAEAELRDALRETYPQESYPEVAPVDPEHLVRRHRDLLVRVAGHQGVPDGQVPAARAANRSAAAACAGTSEPAGASPASSARIRSATSTEESKKPSRKPA